LEVGIGTTGLCNLNCSHCYSRKYSDKNITLDNIKRLFTSVDITSVNFGTGENILNPEFKDILEFFHEKNVKMSLTTNGYTVSKLSNEFYV